jgi:hypothetical protein
VCGLCTFYKIVNISCFQFGFCIAVYVYKLVHLVWFFLVTDQKLVLFLGPFLLLKNGAEKAKPDYWPSLFPCQFSISNVAPFLGPCFGCHPESRKFSLYKQKNEVPFDCCLIQLCFLSAFYCIVFKSMFNRFSIAEFRHAHFMVI